MQFGEIVQWFVVQIYDDVFGFNFCFGGVGVWQDFIDEGVVLNVEIYCFGDVGVYFYVFNV